MSRETEKAVTMYVAAFVALLGLAAVVRGVGMWSAAAGWVAAGVFVVIPSTFIAYSAAREK